jgi:hypothetical protein
VRYGMRVTARIPIRALALPMLVAAAVLLVLPAVANARDGRPWPKRTITYYDATQDKLAVRNAVAAWHRTGVRIRFERVFNMRRADLVIRNSRRVPGGCGTGLATLGYPGPGRQAYIHILKGSAADGQACALPGQTFVVAHELGHVLGLGHFDAGCALMNSGHVGGIAASGCVPGESVFDRVGQWRCRLVEPHDIRRAIRIYGGQMRPVRQNPWCTIVQKIAAPAPFTVVFDELAQRLTLTWRRPATPAVPPYLNTGPRAPRFELYQRTGACLTTLPPGELDSDTFAIAGGEWDVAEGADKTTSYQRMSTGPTCWSVWAFDTMGRPGSRPATAQLELPPFGAPRSRLGPGSTQPDPGDTGEATPERPETIDLSGDTLHHDHLH